MSRPTRRASRSRPDRREEIREKLLVALEEQLDAGSSFQGVKVEDLAAAAGISRASFYIYFQDKVELLEDWIVETRQRLLDASNEWFDCSVALTPTQLHAFLSAIFEVYHQRLALMTAVYEIAQSDQVFMTELAAAFDAQFDSLTKHIRNGQRMGFISDELDARATAEWLTCMIERIAYELRRDGRPPGQGSVVDGVVRVVWATLYAPSHAVAG